MKMLRDTASQSLWVRDRFLIDADDEGLVPEESQSLWVRDRFLISGHHGSSCTRNVAIPLGQGQVFNSQGCFFSLFSMCCRGIFQLLFL